MRVAADGCVWARENIECHWVAKSDFKVYCFKKSCVRETISPWWIIGKWKKEGRVLILFILF